MTRSRAILIGAKLLELYLDSFEKSDQDAALDAIIRTVHSLRGEEQAGRYHIDFEDEPPTKPDDSPDRTSSRPALQKLQDSVRDMPKVKR